MVNVVGRARALAQGYYPLSSGSYVLVEPGTEFDLVEGHDEPAAWFEVLEAKAAAKGGKTPKAAKPAVEVPVEPETKTDDLV